MNKKSIGLGDALQISLPKMVKDKKSLDALIDVLTMQECSSALKNLMNICLPKIVQEKEAIDIISEMLEECISTDSFGIRDNVVDGLTGKGDFGEFSINIHEFYGIFWISAPDFDDDGFFTCLENAISFAEHRYGPYIDSYLSGDD